MPLQGNPKQASDHVTGIDRDQGKAVTLQKTQPPQLTLWQTFFPSDPRNKDQDAYSNTAELYDAVPKYFSSKKRMAEQRRDGQFFSSLKHDFRHKDRHYLVKITPARIEEKDGTEREYYPTWREELVEEALKKLACDHLNGVYLNGVAGVQFTLYELRKELKSRGHDIHLHDLIKSLLICRRTNITITSKQDDGSEVFMDSSIFPTLVITKRREWEKNPKGTRCYVQFNPPGHPQHQSSHLSPVRLCHLHDFPTSARALVPQTLIPQLHPGGPHGPLPHPHEHHRAGQCPR
jgi:hypothetical protein